MNKKEYNGWYNYETWCVSLWVGNDQGPMEFWNMEAQNVYLHSEPGELDWQTREFVATRELAEHLKEDFEDSNPCRGSNVYSDLMRAALSEVNWQEIAEHLMENVDKSPDTEEVK